MPQFARPTEDRDNSGAFTTHAGAPAPLYEQIDEAIASDADFIQSPEDPTDAVYVTRLTAVTNPESAAGHVLSVRARGRVAIGGAPVDLVAELRLDYVDESDRGTL